jgi:quinol monooxygenase YgiN
MRARTGVPALRRTRTQGGERPFFLYEICDSRAAFGTHLPSPHLATFNTTSADLVMNENVAKLHFIFEASNNRR